MLDTDQMLANETPSIARVGQRTEAPFSARSSTRNVGEGSHQLTAYLFMDGGSYGNATLNRR